MGITYYSVVAVVAVVFVVIVVSRNKEKDNTIIIFCEKRSKTRVEV